MDYILASLPQHKATEHDVRCKSHERKVEVRRIDVMTRRLVFQPPCHLFCYSGPMALHKDKLTSSEWSLKHVSDYFHSKGT
jgi:hypothetical protein